ncbi:glycosyltransferase family 2 protein [Candidatus Parcubacteria bacterium]|nr:glycosyltransferase family 2 protein [Candidatus Parcubacteria bacterium]
MQKLSIIIPIYNEANTVGELIKRVEAVNLDNITKELVLIDDGSTDGTVSILRKYKDKYKVIIKKKNQGKGAAVRTGYAAATGDIVIVQDADLEYDPSEYKEMIAPILAGKADAVYGSRFISSKPHRVLYYWHYLGNQLLTLFSNMCTNLNLTDMETCYKAMNRKALDLILPKLSSNRFGIEPETTALLARNKLRIYEIGISYSGRTYEEGKKINWKDGVSAVWCIIKFNLLRR